MSVTTIPRPFIIPVFLPYRGCPHRCTYCNQQITGEGAFTGDLDAYLRSSAIDAPLQRPREAAFYGGSFTCMDDRDVTRYLETASRLKSAGIIDRIRVSTRPDGIDDARLAILRRFDVDTVELGVQSMNDEALARTERGHTAADARRAIGQLRSAGISAGAHVMIGLPGEGLGSILRGAKELASSGISFVRIHPVIVLADTALADDYAAGRYTPLTLETAVLWSYAVRRVFDRGGVSVIRTGLQQTVRMGEGGVVAGPQHPSFGEMVASLGWYHRIRTALRKGADVVIRANPRDISQIAGNHRRTFAMIERLVSPSTARLTVDESIPPGEFALG